MASERNKKIQIFDVISWIVMAFCLFLLFAPGRPGYAAVAGYIQESKRSKILEKRFTELTQRAAVIKSGQQIRLVEFADYECPYCLKALAVIDSFKAARPDYGIGFRHVIIPEHAKALPAARLAVCLDRAKMLPRYHDRLFGLAQTPEPPSELPGKLEALLPDSTYINSNRECMKDVQGVDAQLKTDEEWAELFAVTATPTFVGPQGAVTGVPTLAELLRITAPK